MSRYFNNVNWPEQPKNMKQLQERLDSIVGYSVADFSQALDLPMPESSTKAKGYVGELIELLLGANAQNLPVPDFTHLNIELKSMPVDENFEPLESTFLCHAPLTEIRGLTFEKSPLLHKVRSMLFVFVLAPRRLALPHRRILDYYLFQPTDKELNQIKSDYDELMGLVTSGRSSEITARMGTIVQMRPKCADGKQLIEVIDEDGKTSFTRPRGFYMRRSFSRQICRRVSFRHPLPLPLTPEEWQMYQDGCSKPLADGDGKAAGVQPSESRYALGQEADTTKA